MPRPGPHIIEFYRVDPWPIMRRVLVTGSAILTTGGLVIGVSFLARQSVDVRLAAMLTGFALIFFGAAFTILGMHRILRGEVSLVLRSDGVCIQSDGAETLVPWDDLQAVRWDAAAGCLVLERATGEPLSVPRPILPHPAGRKGGPELAARVLQLKRRAALNLRS